MNNPITPASSLQYPVGTPTGVQLANAVQEAPQANAERDTKLAETQLAGQEAQEKKQQESLDALGKYANMPGIDKGPLGLKILTEHAKAAGIEIPKNPLGGIDIAALRGMFAKPIKQFSDLTPDEVTKWRTRPGEERPDFPGAPSDWKTSQPVTPLSEKAMELWMKPIAAAEAQIGKGQGPQQARGLYSAVKNAYNGMMAHGQTGEADALAQTYLNANKTDLSDQWKEQQAGQLVDAQIQNLHKLGIFRGDEIKIRQEMIDEKKREWNNLSAYQKGELSVQDRRLSAQASQFGAKLSIMQQNLQARWAGVQNARDNIGLRQTALGANTYARMLNASSGAMRTARGQLSQTVNVLNQMSQNSHMRNSQQFQDLTAQAASLQDFLTTQGPILETESQTANQGMASVMSGITGNPSQVINPPTMQPLKILIQTQQGQAPPQAQQAQGQAQGQPQQGGKVLPRATVIEIGKKRGLSPEQAVQDAQKHGYTVQ